MASDPDAPLPTSFSSVPETLIEAVRTVVEQEGGTFMRPVYESAIMQLCDDLDAGLIIETWPASRPGGSRLKKTIRLDPGIAARMNQAVKHHHIGKGIFFRVALIRWLAKRGVDYPL